MFKKMWPKKITHELINFSGQNASTGQVGEYILKELYENNFFSYIGYKFDKIDGELRFTLYTTANPSTKLISYFKDRCPAMVEEKVRSYNGIPHKFIELENGFSFVTTRED